MLLQTMGFMCHIASYSSEYIYDIDYQICLLRRTNRCILTPIVEVVILWNLTRRTTTGSCGNAK